MIRRLKRQTKKRHSAKARHPFWQTRIGRWTIGGAPAWIGYEFPCEVHSVRIDREGCVIG